MIDYIKGDLLSVKEGIIVHGCNSHGIMGAGVALAIKTKYPAAYYMSGYRLSEERKLGEIYWWDNEPLYIANAITQKDFGRDGNRYVNYSAIAKAFYEVFEFAKHKMHKKILDVHFPMIGAGLGGGDWEIIEQIINDCDPDNEINKTCWVL